MIPPNASLVKYDNPVLVSRNTDKKTPRVCFDKNTSINSQLISFRTLQKTFKVATFHIYCHGYLYDTLIDIYE